MNTDPLDLQGQKKLLRRAVVCGVALTLVGSAGVATAHYRDGTPAMDPKKMPPEQVVPNVDPSPSSEYYNENNYGDSFSFESLKPGGGSATPGPAAAVPFAIGLLRRRRRTK